MGWFHVAEEIIDPFGNDDNDFNVNLFIDRNIKAAEYIVKDSFDHFSMDDYDILWHNIWCM